MTVSSDCRPRGAPRPTFGLVGALLVVALVASACQSSAPGAYQYKWYILFDSIFHPDGLIINGIWLTVSIAVVSQIIGVVLGILAALARLSSRAIPRWIASIYIWLFRGTPLLVQISFIFYGLGVTKIYAWPDFVLNGTLIVSGAVQAGICALGVNEGAYMAEIVRAGIISIDPGQAEAAKSLGMTYGQTMRRIILPQAARVIVPPLGNEFNNMLKNTSLLVVIAVTELYVTFSNKNGSGSTSFHPLELFLAAAFWYLVLTTIWGFIQAWIERRLGQGMGPGNDRITARQRLLGFRFGEKVE
ncbi:MAG TPA: amino acid ABC transporter permease [Candidatus Limnocylindrales bacterium]|nr:amino acid ABC transporter permease [Candidatus Limnocylindrales bacterium]